MLIQFTQDFRGKLTSEQFYTAGTVIDLDDDDAQVLIRDGHAIPVEAVAAPIMHVTEAGPESTVEPSEVFVVDETDDDDDDAGELDPGVYDGWTRADLYTAAVERELDVTTRDTKAELLAALLDSDQEAGYDGTT